MSEDAGLVEQREALYKLLPEDLRGEEGSRLHALWSGLAAPLAQAKAWITSLFEQALIGTGSDIWLTLHAKGLGVERLQDETDAQLRIRMRNTQDRVTPSAIATAISKLLSTVSELGAYVIDRNDGPGFGLEVDALEQGAWFWEWNAFLLYLPSLEPAEAPSGMEAGALEEEWFELMREHVIYTLIRAETVRCRAAGIRVFYVLYV